MAQRRQIRLLPINVANKIAAGEVVERPASVVKELIENALDAGATRIEVVITAGGRKLISVADDGCGMDHDNALMCLEPQATSKIRDVDDIERIATYGFRGEAIPSIAAVSRFTIRTCAEGETTGTCVEVAGGQIQGVTEIGFPQGTTFEVRDLFFNVPARRKFLKSYQTEQTHIRTAFMLQALSHPETAMRFKADGREVWNLPGGATLEERVMELFGRDFIASMRPMKHEQGQIRISGFVGVPTLSRSERSEQYVFVNKRAATAAVIPYALREAYPDPDHRPVVVLFVDLPPEDVDVNVHPMKREVRFRDASAVRDAIIAAVSDALGVIPRAHLEPSPAAAVTPTTISNFKSQISESFPQPTHPTSTTPPLSPLNSSTPNSSTPPLSTLHSPLSTLNSPLSTPPLPTPVPPPPVLIDETEESGGPWAWCRVLGQIHDGFLLVETDGGYAVIDPQAAHERVIYERLLSAAQSNEPISQTLLMPQSVSLPPADAERITANLDILRSMGFAIDPFGSKGEFIVEALPVGLERDDARSLLADLAHGIATSGVKRGTEKWRERSVAIGAAMSAISRTASLAPEAQARLVRDLAATRMPYTSPRGRPTMLFTSLSELARKFGRAT